MARRQYVRRWLYWMLACVDPMRGWRRKEVGFVSIRRHRALSSSSLPLLHRHSQCFFRPDDGLAVLLGPVTIWCTCLKVLGLTARVAFALPETMFALHSRMLRLLSVRSFGDSSVWPSIWILCV